MTGRIAYFSWGMTGMTAEIGMLSGLEPAFCVRGTRRAEAVAGWGHKPTANRARAAARRAGLPYIAFEDGFLRSLRPGSRQPPASMVMDRSGIYYDATGPSDLETLLETADFSDEELSRAQGLLALIARHRLSKYNNGTENLSGLDAEPGQPIVLVVDQTLGDASVSGALADASTFDRMLLAAIAENPGARVVARLHPETVAGTKQGYLMQAAHRMGVPVLSDPVSPWCLFDLRPRVYTVSSQFGFEALLAGCDVTCFGIPFYAGWGLTADRLPCSRRTRRRSREELAAAVYLRYCRYFDCWRRVPVQPETAIEQLAFLRQSYLSNGRPIIGYRIARWKQKAVAAMLDGPCGPPRFTRSLASAKRQARAQGAVIAAWGIEAVKLREPLRREGFSCIAIEDGFLRSVGLGAAFTQPLSLVFDTTGLYYDATRPSDIEAMLSDAELSAETLDRARALRNRIVADRITKYNVARHGSPPVQVPADRPVVLVPGQVADDWAVLIGRPPGFAGASNINGVLLERVRAAHPGAFVIFKPHPDVEHLGRAGALDSQHQSSLADLVARHESLEYLLPLATSVETYSSLAGFEALLRGIRVTVHGRPFYAGWGLTRDHAEAPRRGRNRTLDELTAVALVQYPRYWDPVSGLACPPEVVLDRIASARTSGRGGWAPLGTAAGRGVIMARRLWRAMKGPADVP
ncbi:capsular polysaccharide biosynthesis protein [Aestuariivirga sp.]|uniref:capsular polysaccharide biosynthesis protein n=1 Tax=Aestuariivirga sp. TaxID=2650926 RepID=UPI003593F7C3